MSPYNIIVPLFSLIKAHEMLVLDESMKNHLGYLVNVCELGAGTTSDFRMWFSLCHLSRPITDGFGVFFFVLSFV